MTEDELGTRAVDMLYDGSMLSIGGMLRRGFLHRCQGFAIREDGGVHYVVKLSNVTTYYKSLHFMGERSAIGLAVGVHLDCSNEPLVPRYHGNTCSSHMCALMGTWTCIRKCMTAIGTDKCVTRYIHRQGAWEGGGEQVLSPGKPW